MTLTKRFLLISDYLKIKLFFFCLKISVISSSALCDIKLFQLNLYIFKLKVVNNLCLFEDDISTQTFSSMSIITHFPLKTCIKLFLTGGEGD